jgi:two-component system, OmpR family, phosphate regulon sensor histidine kinase PhoR
MQRVSARVLIVVSWLLTSLLLLVAARASVGSAIAALLVTAGVAFGVTTLVARRLRSMTMDIRLLTMAAHERDTATASAALAEQQMVAVIESISEGILQVNTRGRCVHVNPAGRALLNLPADVRGQSITALIRNPELRHNIERAARGEAYEPLEVVFDERHLLVSSHPLRSDQTSDVSGAVIAIVDLTEFRRLETVRRDFVANVSHELKTPLTSIRGYAETLLTDDLPEEMRTQFLEVIYKNTERIQRIVDDLLDLSRLQSGGWQPELQEVDPANLAEDVWAGCEAAHRKQLSFQVVAPAARDVLADPGGLRQVLSNLFENAIRYTPPGGRVSVAVRPGPTSHYIELVVTDSGSGIPSEALPRIFERFYRVDPARSRQEGGTGLGLSIVKHLVERMSGEVSAESEFGKGTTIRVTLPAAPN